MRSTPALPVRRTTLRLRAIFALVATMALVATASAAASPPALVGKGTNPQGLIDAPPGAQVVSGSYIVVLNEGSPVTVARQHAQLHGARVGHVYGTAIQGYAATMSAQAATAIARDSRVAWVEPETIETIQSRDIPSGLDRIEADRHPTFTPVEGAGPPPPPVQVPIAVLDTGIADHPDLNVVDRVDCTIHSGGPQFSRQYSCVEGGSDSNGHGTHVAGTIGANGDILGVAPGTPLYSVKVCQNNGCPSGAINAGIDWVAEQKKKGSVDFAAANFSISSQDSDNSCSEPANATHRAICGLANTGVSFVMAAGNDDRLKTPYPVAFSVSAIADFDGKAGGAGEPTCRNDDDDTLANFSNYGPHIDIAAPGVCILSTWNDGGYNTISGTSMSAPHVTGAIALYLHANDLDPAVRATEDPGAVGLSVAEIEEAITGAAHDPSDPCGYAGKERSGNHVLGGPLLFVNADVFKGDGGCTVAAGDEDTTEPEPEPEGPTASFTFSCNELICDFDGSGSQGDPQDYKWDFGDGSEAVLEKVRHTYNAAGTYSVTLTVTDGGDKADSVTEEVTVSVTGDVDDISLDADGYKVRGLQKVDLSWIGATNVHIYRDGTIIATASNTGSYTDNIDLRGGGSYTYKVCEAATTTCSGEVTVTF